MVASIEYSLIIILGFLLSFDGLAQSCKIALHGTVIDYHEALGLGYATIYVQEAQKLILADSIGSFIINDLCPGQYHFVVSHLGCETKTFFETVVNSQKLDFYLEHHHEVIEEISITSFSNQAKIGLNKTSLSKELLNELSGKQLAEIVSSTAGVSLIRTGPNVTKPIIHGLFGNRITILNHGIPQEGQSWGNDHAPEIDASTADKISIYKGSNAIKYGLQALGGVIVIDQDQSGYDPHLHGEVKSSFHTNGRGLSLGGMLKKATNLGNMKGTANFLVSGDKYAPDYYLTNTGERQQSLSISLDNKVKGNWNRSLYYSYFRNVNGILRGSNVGNLSDLNAALTRKQPFNTRDTFGHEIAAPNQRVSHQLLKHTTNYIIDDQRSLHFDIGIQYNHRREFDIRRGVSREKPALDLTLFTQYYDFTFFNTKQNSSRTLGLQYRNANNTNQPGTSTLPLLPDYFSQLLAVYGTQSLFINNDWIGEVGARLEYRNYAVARINSSRVIERINSNYYNYALNLGLKRNFGSSRNTSLDISYVVRPPEVSELFSLGLHQGVSSIEEGNPSLSNESSFKIVNEWNWAFSHATTISSSIYFHHFQNFIYLQPSDELRLTVRGAFPVFNYTQVDTRLTGLDLNINHEFGSKFTNKLSLSYVSGHNITRQIGLIWTPPFSVTESITYRIRRLGKFIDNNLKIECSYIAKQGNVPLEEDFLPPPDGYFLISAVAKTKVSITNGRSVDIILRGENLANTSFRSYLNRQRYFADDLGRNISLILKTSF